MKYSRLNRHFGAKIPISSYLLAGRTLYSGQLTQGHRIQQLEELFSRETGFKHAIATSSGTAALHLCLLYLREISDKTEVVVPAYSFVATANAVSISGLSPIFADVAPGKYVSNSEYFLPLASEKTAAFVPVHEFGYLMDYSELEDYANFHDIAIIHDAACAVGQPIVPKFSRNNFVVYSFHPRKIITSGEGGMILTNDNIAAESIRSLLNHGFANSRLERQLIKPGLNYRLTDIAASILIPQVEKIKKIVEKRKAKVQFLQSQLQNDKLDVGCRDDGTGQTFTILIHPEEVEGFKDYMSKHGINVFKPAQFIPRENFYNQFNLNEKFPNTSFMYQRSFAIPFSDRMTTREMRKLIELLNKF